ncbi:MAG: hypothetical protein AB1586_17650 [Pseudomonadota bacterium]
MLKAGLWALSLSSWLAAGAAMAQDVPGIEICTAEKTMERRTSCLQSNVDFLKKTMTQDALAQQQKLDAASREIVALKARLDALGGTVTVLQKTLEQLQAQAQQAADKKSKDAPKDAPKDPPAK